jgi:hypothetical protein
MKKRMEITFKLQGNIEGDVVICNISKCNMILPAKFCRETEPNLIEIPKRDFKRLERNKEIIFR